MNRRSRMLLFVLVATAVAAGPTETSAPHAQTAASGQASTPREVPAGRGAFGIRIGLPPVVLPDEAYLEWPLTPAQQVYGKISGAHMKDLVKQIVAISEKSRADGNQYWGRIAGSPYDAMTRAWVVDQFKRVGLEEVRDQPVTLAPIWWPN